MNKIKLYLSEEIAPLRNQLDPLADAAVLDLIAHPVWIRQMNSWTEFPAELPKEIPENLAHFLEFYHTPFPLEDREGELVAVQNLFLKNAPLVLSLLGFYALPYTYAFGDGAEVLVRSKRMVNEPGKRLAETAFFILECYRPGSFVFDNRILIVLAKVRLIHAFSRYFILLHDKSWNFEWGLPINQEDLIATNLTFSLLIYRGLEKSGKGLNFKDKTALLFYWKIIGHFLGLQTSYWPDSPKEAYELEKLIRKRHLRSSSAGKILIKSLISYYQSEKVFSTLSPVMEDLIAFFIGKAASDALGLQPKNFLSAPVLSRMIYLSSFGFGGPPKDFLTFQRQFMQQAKDKYGFRFGLYLPELR